jgi:hypothetical protein
MRSDDAARSDVHEGRHVDAPRHPVSIEIFSTGRKIMSDFEFHNIAGKPNQIFIHSFTASKSVANKFGPFVVEIKDVTELEKRTKRSLARLNVTTKLDQPYLKSGLVTYYEPQNANIPNTDLKNASELVFLKQRRYTEEQEYRFSFSRKGGVNLVQKITTKGYTPLEDIKNTVDKSAFIDVENLAEISFLT